MLSGPKAFRNFLFRPKMASTRSLKSVRHEKKARMPSCPRFLIPQHRVRTARIAQFELKNVLIPKIYLITGILLKSLTWNRNR